LSRYFFLLGINNSGSTIVSQYIASSSNGFLPEFGNNEGQDIPEIQEILATNTFDWNPSFRVPWGDVKKIYDSYLHDSGKKIFIEKSPPNVIRAAEIAEHFFDNDKFIGCCLISNPYMFIGSCIKNYIPPWELNDHVVEQLTKEWIWKVRIQFSNSQKFDLQIIRYEDFTLDPKKIIEPILNSFGISIKNSNPTIRGKNRTGFVSTVMDMTPRHIAFLKQHEIDLINKTLHEDEEILDKVNYSIFNLEDINKILSSNLQLSNRGLLERCKYDTRTKPISLRMKVLNELKALFVNRKF